MNAPVDSDGVQVIELIGEVGDGRIIAMRHDWILKTNKNK